MGVCPSSLHVFGVQPLQELGPHSHNKLDSFPVGVRLHQGSPLSPILLIIFMEAKLLIYRLMYVEMSFLQRVADLSLRDGVRKLGHPRGIERSQLRWFRHVTRMPPGRGILGISHWEKGPGANPGHV